MYVSTITVVLTFSLITVSAHEDTNNFIFTKYAGVLFEIIALCADTVWVIGGCWIG